MLRREGEAAAGGEIVGGKAAFALDHHASEGRAARGIQRGAEQGFFVFRFDQGQPRRIKAEPGQPLAMEAGLATASPARTDEEQRALSGAGGNEGEGEGGGAILPRGVDFVEAAVVQPRNPCRFPRRGRKARVFLKGGRTGHLRITCYVLIMFHP